MSGAEPMPYGLRPMLASPGMLPPDGTGWVYETKWDGIRAMTAVSGSSVRMWSRAGNDLTDQFPEFAALASAVGGHDVLLDGEIVAFGDDGTPSFNRLQQRLGLGRTAAVARSATIPALLIVFDLLHLDGTSTRDLPLEERRAALDALELGGGSSWHVSALHEDGSTLSEITKAANLEGVIAKRLGSPYLAGVRTRTWMKVKHHQTDAFVIGGWVPGSGKRATSIGSLLVGMPTADAAGTPRLRWVGRVGTGFSERELNRLVNLLVPLATPASPFDGPVSERTAVYVAPKLWVRVEYHEFTPDGLMRFPTYKGLVDPPAEQV